MPTPKDTSSPGTDLQTAPPPPITPPLQALTPNPQLCFSSEGVLVLQAGKQPGRNLKASAIAQEPGNEIGREKQNLISHFGPQVVTSVAAGCGQARRHPSHCLWALPV